MRLRLRLYDYDAIMMFIELGFLVLNSNSKDEKYNNNEYYNVLMISMRFQNHLEPFISVFDF